MYYVYTYIDKATNVPFYIGKGKVYRSTAHLNLCKNVKCGCYHTPFYRKLRKMLKAGLSPGIEKVFKSSCEQTCFNVEKFLIASYGRRKDGGVLTNLTHGGDGSSGHVFTAESKRKMSEVALKRSPESRLSTIQASTGCKRSSEVRRKQSERLKGRKVSKDIRMKIAASLSKPVESFDILTGETVQWFPSAVNAESKGFRASNIRGVVAGAHKTHKGLGWRAASQQCEVCK